MKSLVNYVVKYVDKGVLCQPVAHFVKLELESSESLGNLSDQGVRFLLVFFIRRYEVVEETE